MVDNDNCTIEHFADEVCRRGLRTPTLMLCDLFLPLGFFGEQLLLGLGPLLPFHRWREGAQLALIVLRDEQKQALLKQRLQQRDS